MVGTVGESVESLRRQHAQDYLNETTRGQPQNESIVLNV